MRIRAIKDLRDLRGLSSGEWRDLLDELRAIAANRGTALIGQGRAEARRAIGAPDAGAVPAALIGGMVLGAIVGAALAILVAPWSGVEARRRLNDRVDRMRERAPQMRMGGNGRVRYEPEPMPTETVELSDLPS